MKSSRVPLFLLILLVALAIWWIYRPAPERSPDDGPKPVLALVTGGTQAYWTLIGNGAQAAAKDLDIELDVKMPEQDEDAQLQSQIISGVDLKKVQGIGISPVDAEGQTPLLNRIAGQAFLVTFDSDAPKSLRQSYVGASNLAAGRTSAEVVREAIPDGGVIAVFMANLTKENMIERKAGFEEAIAQEKDRGGETLSDYEVVDYLLDQGDAEQAVKNVKEVLAAHADLKCLVGLNGHHGAAFMQALEELDQLGKIQVVAFDESAETLGGIESGNIFATVAQDPYQYGYETVRVLANLCRAQERERPLPGSKSTLNISTKVVSKDNLEEFRKELESRRAVAAK